MHSKTLDIDDSFGEEFQGRYVFAEITIGTKNRITQRYTHYNRVTGIVEEADYAAIQAEILIASLKEQPKNKPLSVARWLSETEGIPARLADLLWGTCQQLNSLDASEIRFLLLQLDEGSRIQLFRSFDYAKSSPDLSKQNMPTSQQKESSNSP